jgi:hypothetical protein
MKIKILNNVETDSAEVDKYPDHCPFCHKSILPILITAIYHNPQSHRTTLQTVFQCPSKDCSKVFISYYIRSDLHRNYYYLYETMFGNFKPPLFNETIKTISEDYCKIYTESYASEQLGLKQVSGVGYRKSLEFLIKDYLIKIKGIDENTIKNKYLGKCINEDINNEKIKNVAKRAAWLGNDETHYFRKWEDKDITNLKDLIRLTVNWIEDETLTEKYKTDMPEQ